MDPTDSNQEAKAVTSSEETSSFEQYTYSRELFESDTFSLSEEDMLPPEKFVCDADRLRHDATAPSPWKQKYRLKLLQN